MKRPVEAQLHIERLVLRGFSALDAQRVRDAFSTALAEPLVLPGCAETGPLRLSIADTGRPEALGRAAAQALRMALQR